MKKENIIKVLLGIIVIMFLFGIYFFGNQWINNERIESYNDGAQYGFDYAVEQLINVMVNDLSTRGYTSIIYQNQTINLVVGRVE